MILLEVLHTPPVSVQRPAALGCTPGARAPFTPVPSDDLFLLSPAVPWLASRDDEVLKSAADPFSPCGKVGGCPAGEQVEKGKGNLFNF